MKRTIIALTTLALTTLTVSAGYAFSQYQDRFNPERYEFSSNVKTAQPRGYDYILTMLPDDTQSFVWANKSLTNVRLVNEAVRNNDAVMMQAIKDESVGCVMQFGTEVKPLAIEGEFTQIQVKPGSTAQCSVAYVKTARLLSRF